MAEPESRIDQGELVVLVLTVQDLRWGASVDDLDLAELRERYRCLDHRIDLWIRDERHSQYNGAITSTRLGQLHATMELDLTATPYNCVNLYDRQQVVARTLLWGLENRQHTRLPEIGIDALAVAMENLSPRMAELYATAEGYDPRKLFQRENGGFVLEAELVELARRFYHDRISRQKNPLSITNDTDLCEPIRVVRDVIQKEVRVVRPVSSPGCKPATGLAQVASRVKDIDRRRLALIRSSQFPDQMQDAKGVFRKPASW